jgi:hypothetical protein
MRVIDPAYIPVWLRKPVPALGDDKPINLIAAGRYQHGNVVEGSHEQSVAG